MKKRYKLSAMCFFTKSGKVKYINCDLKENVRSNKVDNISHTFDMEK